MPLSISDNYFCSCSPSQLRGFLGHCKMWHAVLKISLASWMERACPLPSPRSKRRPPFWLLCFFFAFHLWATFPCLHHECMFLRGFHKVKNVHFYSFHFVRHWAVISRSHAGLATSGFLPPPQHLQISRNGRQTDTTNGSLWEKSTLLSLLEFWSGSWLSKISDAVFGTLLGPLPQQSHPRQSTDQYWHPV